MSKPAHSKVRLSEIEAAIKVEMSPLLLRWFTRYSPKQGETRKLPYTEENGDYFYDRDDLIAFDKYLREPWPHNGKERPPTPSGIREEVKIEAFCECAVCHNGNDGEAAHIEPVSTTHCNHPANLLWLCPAHHTAYDFGHHVHATLKLPTIKTLKRTLQDAKLRIWRIEQRAANSVLLLVKDVENLRATIRTITASDIKEAFEWHVKQILQTVHGHAVQAAADGTVDNPLPEHADEYRDFAKAVAASTDDNAIATIESLGHAADAVVEARRRYLESSSEVDCPVCHGSGLLGPHHVECPACGGDGVMSQSSAENIDTTQYEFVNCPLCKGNESFRDYDFCPECGGEGELERRHAEMLDVSAYDLVCCPVCKGKGSFRDHDECPECGGSRRVEKRALESIETSKYNLVRCPLCKGKGSFRSHEDCPECGGGGEIEQHALENIDLSKYKLVKCPLCKGKGSFGDHDGCPVCRGDGEVEQHVLENIDLSQYELVKCPLCKGKGSFRSDDCPPCEGRGMVERHVAAEINLSDFE